MIDPIHAQRMERARVVLAREPMTFRRLAVRGVSWRAVMDLLADGEVSIAGSDRRARVIYERTEQHA